MEIVLFVLMLIVPVFSLASFFLSLIQSKRIDALKRVVIANSTASLQNSPIETQISVNEI